MTAPTETDIEDATLPDDTGQEPITAFQREEVDPEKPPERPVLEVETLAELQDVKVSKASNGANYDITFEIDIADMAMLAESGDGHDVTFKGTFIGSGAIVRRMSISRDADSGKHGKISVRFSQSEIRKAIGKLATLIADNNTEGKLIFAPQQMTLDLTRKAE
jgi:hypothetical protein